MTPLRGCVLAALLAGCAPEGGPVRIVARGAGAGYWPANSATAVAGATALAEQQAPLDAIELDVGLTSDEVPVFADGPTLPPAACRHADGSALPRGILLKQRTAAQLRDNVVCGGEPVAAYPQAEVVAEPLLQLGELVRGLHAAPGALEVWLDVHQEAPLTAPPDRFARAVLDPWFAADLPQSLAIVSTEPAVLAAFDRHAREQQVDVALWYAWAPAPAAAEVDGWGAGVDYATLAEEAGADGILIPWQAADPRLLRAARDAGVQTGLWTLDAPRELERVVDAHEVDAVLTSFPGDAPWSR